MEMTNRINQTANGKATGKANASDYKHTGTKPRRSHFHATVEDLARNDAFALKVFKNICVPDMVAYLSHDSSKDKREQFAIYFFSELRHADEQVRDVAAFALGELIDAVPFRPEFLGWMLKALCDLPAFNQEGHDTAIMMAGLKLSAALQPLAAGPLVVREVAAVYAAAAEAAVRSVADSAAVLAAARESTGSP